MPYRRSIGPRGNGKIAKPNAEKSIHRQVCAHIRMNYPGIIFVSDGSGNRLSKTQAIEAAFLRSSRGIPDLIVFVARGGYHGLVLELKADGVKVCLKPDCTLVSHKHVHEQAVVLEALRAAGYYAEFAIGYTPAEQIIDWYLKLETPPK